MAHGGIAVIPVSNVEARSARSLSHMFDDLFFKERFVNKTCEEGSYPNRDCSASKRPIDRLQSWMTRNMPWNNYVAMSRAKIDCH